MTEENEDNVVPIAAAPEPEPEVETDEAGGPKAGLSLRLAIMGYNTARNEVYEIVTKISLLGTETVEDCIAAAKANMARAEVSAKTADEPIRTQARETVDGIYIELKLYRALQKFAQQLKEIDERQHARDRVARPSGVVMP